jgi:hypothetical protein
LGPAALYIAFALFSRRLKVSPMKLEFWRATQF